METKKPLSDEQLEQVTGGTSPIMDEDGPSLEEIERMMENDTPCRIHTCPYCGQAIPPTWWDQHMESQHPGKPIP